MENPAAADPHTPPNSQVVVDTRPMAAEAPAPIRPTMDASIYCIITEVICAMIAGVLKDAARRHFCLKDSSCPFRI